MSIHLDNNFFNHNRDDCHGYDKDDCRSVVKKNVGVRTPVALDVNTRTGNVKIVCSTPHVTSGPSHSDCNSSKCEFTINQLISVEIPISYCVCTDVKRSYVECDFDADAIE